MECANNIMTQESNKSTTMLMVTLENSSNINNDK